MIVRIFGPMTEKVIDRTSELQVRHHRRILPRLLAVISCRLGGDPELREGLSCDAYPPLPAPALGPTICDAYGKLSSFFRLAFQACTTPWTLPLERGWPLSAYVTALDVGDGG